MEGRCRRCGEKLSLLQRLQGQDFCSPEHKAEFQREQEQMALARLQQSASNLRKPLDTPRLGTRRDGAASASRTDLPALGDDDPPLVPFLEHWKSSTPLAPLPLTPEEEILEPASRWPKFTGSIAWGHFIDGQIPLSLASSRGDVITILAPRTSPVVVPAAPSWPRVSLVLEEFPWAMMAARLDGGPPEAGLVAPRGIRARVHEPAVRWLEASEAGFPRFAPIIPAPEPATWNVAGIARPVSPVPMPDYVRVAASASAPADALQGPAELAVKPAAVAGGERGVSARLVPGLARCLAVRVRFGHRRPKRQRVPVSAEELQMAPMLGADGLAILSPVLRGPTGLARRAEEARPAAPAPLPHFAAVRVAVEPQRLTYAPDLTPIAIASNWLAPKVEVPVWPVNGPSPMSGSPFFVPESGEVQSRVSITGLDAQAERWMIPRVAGLVGLSLRGTAPAPAAPAGPEEFQWFTHTPCVNHEITSLRAGVPGGKGRIKMEVQLEPPVANPWFEPLTCAFGGDPYGAR